MTWAKKLGGMGPELCLQGVCAALLALTVRTLLAPTQEPGGVGSAPIGKLSSAANDVRLKPARVSAWDAAVPSSPLYARDSLYTGKESSAKIELADGATLELGENSLVVLEATPAKEAPRVAVVRGEVAAKAGAAGVELALPNGAGTVSVKEESEAAVAGAASGGFEVRVLKGGAALEAGHAVRKLAAQEAALAAGDGKLGQVQRLPFSVTSPAAGAAVVAGRSVRFAWTARPGVKGARLQVAADQGFQQILADKDVEGATAVALPVSAGTRFWRLVADAGRSEPRRLEAFDARAPRLLAPGDGEAVSGSDGAVVLAWERLLTAKGFRVEVFDDPSLRHRVRADDVEAGPLTVRLPGPGVYSWRVAALYPGDGAVPVVSDPSPARRLAFAAPVPAQAPELASPAAGAQLTTGEGAPTVALAWRARPGRAPASYMVEIAAGSDFGAGAAAFPTSQTSLAWRPPAPGAYVWRVTALDESRRPQATTEGRPFQVKGGGLRLIGPKGDMDPKPGEPLKFLWTEVWGIARYSFALARASAPDEPFVAEVVDGATFHWAKPVPGRYVWRVTAIGDSAGPVEGTFTIKTHALAPPPLQATYELEAR